MDIDGATSAGVGEAIQAESASIALDALHGATKSEKKKRRKKKKQREAYA